MVFYCFFFLRIACLCLILSVSTARLNSQNTALEGSESQALAGCNLALLSPWSVNNNPALLPKIEMQQFGISHSSPFLIKELNSHAACLAVPHRKSHSGLGLSLGQWGFNEFVKHEFGFSYGMKLNQVFSLGLQLNFQRIAMNSTYGSRGFVNANLAFSMDMNEDLQLGGMILNVRRNQLTDDQNDLMEQQMRFGLTYKYTDYLHAHLQFQKSIAFPISIRMGVNYVMANYLSLQMGVASAPFQLTFGIELRQGRLSIQTASQFQYLLGFSPSISLRYQLQKSTQ